MDPVDPVDSGQAERRRRRRKKRQDEESIDSVSTISKIVEEERERETLDTDIPDSRRKKKLKKIKESSNDDPEEGLVKPRRKKKKKRAASVSSSGEAEGEAEVEEKRGKRRKDRRRTGGSEALPREDFYSDPQLATTLQGLEDDMYSLCGEQEYQDTSVLSPYPLIPSIPTSQPVAKIYLEKSGGFSKTSVSAAVVSSNNNITSRSSPEQSPLALGLATQRIFRAASTFCHGFLAGLAAWQVFTIYILHNDDLEFVSLYSPLSQPLMITFYLLTIICTVSVCDRYDLAEFSLYHLRKLLTLQSGGVSILIYWATLLLTLVTTRLDDKLSLFQHNSSLFEDMEPQDLSQELQTWKVKTLLQQQFPCPPLLPGQSVILSFILLPQAMNLTRSIAVVVGWFIVSLRPSTDLLYKHLKRLNTADRWKTSRIETVKMA